MNDSKGSSYRKLRFDSIQECIDEVNRIAQAQEQGKLKASGNWTAGEVFSHVAAWIEYGYVGYPIKPLPFFIRWLLRVRLRKMLEVGMTKGVRIPGIKEGTTGIDDLPTGQAAQRLLSALGRLTMSQHLTTAQLLGRCRTRTESS
ncbi:MAG: DUF1569 domain-containing protein [Pirellula sp.]